MTKRFLNAKAGPVDVSELEPFHNDNFGYTLYEDVVDPENPEGPKAIVMRVPANSLSKAWLLKENGYSERIELLEGIATLVINRAKTCEWETVALTPDNPTGDDTILGRGDIFCVVAGGSDTVVLSRPSKDFDISFEMGITKNPTEQLSRHILGLTVKSV